MKEDNQTGGRNSEPSAETNEPARSVQAAFPDEEEHLEEINRKLENALEKADASVARLDRDYTDLQHYMAQNRSEIDPHEMFQNELTLHRIDHTGAFAVTQREKIVRLKDSPYFARIDFAQQGKPDAAVYYIGRFGFEYENHPLIFDWRAPVAGMFYDCTVGAAGYSAPIGRVEGRLTRKRQFKITRGKMEYALESSLAIQDDVLQRELSHTSDEKMKSIIATIQKEQYKVIRSESSKTLLIQGVAGSGKTSIALHRIAFLLYRFQNRLSAENIAILSPNPVFGDYISNVLPELGEEPIFETSFAEIARIQLEGILDFEAERDSLETDDPAWAQRVRFRSTIDFLERMDRYIGEMPDRVFEAQDYAYGRFTATADWITARFRACAKEPVKQRLRIVADDIRETFETDNVMQDDLPSARAILKSLCGMLRMKSTLALYRDFFQSLDAPGLFVMPKKNTLEWADVYPFLYLRAAFEGLAPSRTIRHLVIDEMQDYTPVQYAVINRLFCCQKTILGDFGQRIDPNLLHTLEDLRRVYAGAEFVQLCRSYRSSYEIIRFAGRIQSAFTPEAVERHAEEPEVIEFASDGDELRYLQGRIESFPGSGFSTLGVVVKTNRVAKALFHSLSESRGVHRIAPGSTRFLNGVSITSIQMAKGLEFDEVIVPFANHATYASEQDRNLLYIACTRAMHRLTLTFAGRRTALIGREPDAK